MERLGPLRGRPRADWREPRPGGAEPPGPRGARRGTGGGGTLAGLAEFAAGAGHELNNPLAVIMGRAQLVLGRSPDPEATRSLRAIITQAQRAHRILRDLMFVARPGEFRPRACQPDEIVRASLRDLQDEAEAQGVRLVLDAREPAPKVWADPEPLRQVADILTRNALEASARGATIRFATGGDARPDPLDRPRLRAGDLARRGAHLFDPFYCGRQAGRGLGLGLPRAARIIDLVGGEIRWQSTPGQGATFQVTLPVQEIPGPLVPGRAEPEDPRTPEAAQADKAGCGLRVHRVGDRVALAAKVGHHKRLVIVPVVPFQAPAAATPGAAKGALDHAELLGQGGGIARRPRPDPPRSRLVGGDLQLATQADGLGVQTVLENPFHVPALISCARSLIEKSHDTASRLPGRAAS